MIEIISGVYGYRPRKGVVEPKKPGDAPFSLPAGQEEALVKKGVARYVSEVFEDEVTLSLPAYDASMSVAELKEVALCYGITVNELKPLRSKAAVIAAIEAKLKLDNDDDEGEDNAESVKEEGDDEIGDEGSGGDEEDEAPDPDAPSLEPEEPQA